MKLYSLVILGYPAAQIVASFEMVTRGLVEGFRAMPHVDLLKVVPLADAAAVPACDCVLAHTLFGPPWPFPYDPRLLPARRKRVLVLECPSPSFDHCFVFQPCGAANETVLPISCCRAQLVTVPKDERAVLLDHGWDHTHRDWCDWLYASLEPLRGEFTFAQLGRLGMNTSPPPWMSLIPHQTLPDYLKATERFGTFIPTHEESWGHALADMAARGIRIVAPVGSMRPAMVAAFTPALVTTQEELCAALRAPFDHAALARASAACVDYSEICGIIDRKLQEWM